MIKSVTVSNVSMTSQIYMETPKKLTKYIYIKKIDGLGPVKAEIYTSERPTIDGDRFLSARASARNIVLTLGFTLATDVESARKYTYNMFPLKSKISMEIETDTGTYCTEGYVESNEPDIFSKDETTTISIICPDSYFYAKDEITNQIIDSTLQLYNQGNINIGATITLEFYNDVNTVALTSKAAAFSVENSMTISGAKLPDKKFMAGDKITICTINGKKSASLLRSGKTYNIINALGKYPDWLILYKHNNAISYTVDSSSSISDVMVRVSYKYAYEGI